MASPPLTHPSAPHSPSPTDTSTSIPVAMASIPSQPSALMEEELAASGKTDNQAVDLEKSGKAGQQQPLSRSSSAAESREIDWAFERKKCCCWLQMAWSCVQLWTPLSATFLVYWLIYRPDRYHPRTDSAVLAAFDITNNASLLQYDLAVDLSFRNSHRLSIRYLDVAASVFYNGTRLGPTDDVLCGFFQGPKNTTVLHPAFHGVVTVDSGVASELERERAAGTLHLRVTVSLTLMYKVLFIKDVFFYMYDCWIWFPTPRNNTPAFFKGEGTMCWRA